MALSSSFPLHTVPLIYNRAITCYPAHAKTNMEMVPFALLLEETTYLAATH